LIPDNPERNMGSEENSLYRTLFEISPEGLVFCDQSRRVVLVNDEFCRIFGYERNEAIGRLLDDLVVSGGENLDEARALSEEFRRSGFIQSETVRQRRDGTSFPVFVVAFPVRTGDHLAGSMWIYRNLTEFRKRDEAARIAESKLRGILEAHPELILRFTPDLTVTYANRAYCQYHHIEPEEAIGKSFADHVSPEFIPLVHSKLRSLSPENPAKTGQEKVIMSSGEVRWQEWTDQGIFSDSGELVEIQSVGRDITDRKIMEEALAFERESLSALFENASEGIVLCEGDGTIIRANPMFCEMFGYSTEEVSGRNIDDLVAGDSDYLEEARELTRTTLMGNSISNESTRRKKDGSTIDVSFLGIPVSIREGKRYSYGIYRNISDRKKAEKSIRESEAKYRDLFNTMPNGFYTTTEEGYFVEANPAMIRMLGYGSLEEIKKIHIPTDLYVQKEERTRFSGMREINSGFHEETETYRLRRKDGKIIWMEDYARYIRTDEGTILHQGICRDITERIEAENELRRLNRELFLSATTDKVTGLLSRQHFEEIMAREIAKASRYETPLSLVMLDLDNFKKLNDSRGHLVGDRALLQIATSISDSIRSSDMAARWGGDEFILATPAPLEKAKGLAEKLRKLLEELDHDGFGPITGSFGISSFRNGDTIETLTGRADDLMYAVKRLGGNDIRSTP